MTPARWRQIEDLYHAVRDRDATERAALLAAADPDLRLEVEKLLDQPASVTPRPAWEDLSSGTLPQPAIGSQLGPYRIEARLGAGGMGEVYRALDTRLRRTVAIKVPNQPFDGACEREARSIAALNHPNICTVHDIGPNYLVMELVEGLTLEERIGKGPVPLEEALAISRQIASALETAHERGIVHRDLKPANIKIKPDGTVKVLDFGLARMARDTRAVRPEEQTRSLTVNDAGMLAGTPAYMAPEQALGKAVDKRADIWAFGVVLYEMLSGRRLFKAGSVSETLAAVLRQEPDWAPVPPQVRRLLQRCLERDLTQRLRDIGDAMSLLDEAPAAAPPAMTSGFAWAMAIVLAVALAVAGAGWWRATRPVEHPLTRLSVDLGPEAMRSPNSTAAISPDGRRLVFPARGPNGRQQLATRLLEQAEATLLPGTEDGRHPFFSPDSQWVGFFANGKLKKIAVQGGAPAIICDASFDHGGSWGEDGTIAASLSQQSGLSRTSAAGERPQPLTKLGKGEVTHRWPQLLPGGRAVLFTASPSVYGMGDASVKALSLPGGATKTLIAGYFGRYLPVSRNRGYLVYFHEGALFGLAFDAERLELLGNPVPLLEDVTTSPDQDGGQFDFSAAPSGHGTFVSLDANGAAQTWPVVWLDASGKSQPLIATPGAYGLPQFSPDGRRLALSMNSSSGIDIYVYDLERETMTRLTFTGSAAAPVWAPDGKHIAFQSYAHDLGIGWMRSDGSGEPLQILTAQNSIVPWSISPDGRRLAYRETTPDTGYDIWTVALDTSDPDRPKAGKPEVFVRTPSDELAPVFSPDGRWIVYRSNESGTNEIYVRPFPAERGGKWQISNGGGIYGVWSNNGRELFYETPENRIMVVDYTANGDFVPGKPRLWSEKRIFYSGSLNMALHPDSKRFAVFPVEETVEPEKGTVHVTFVLNFLDELRRRIQLAR